MNHNLLVPPHSPPLILQVTPEAYMEAVEALQPDLYVTMSDEVWGWYELSVGVV